MRILHVIHTLNPVSGGTAEAVRNFLSNPGASRQCVLSLDHSSDPWTREYPAEVHCVGPGRGTYGYNRALPAWLQENVQSYDALIVHGCWQYHTVSASAAARRAAVPCFVFPHGMLDPYFNRASRKKHLKKLVYWPLERRTLESAHAVLFTCSEEKARAHEAFTFRSTDRIVPLGVRPSADDLDAAREDFLFRFPEVRGKRAILFLGRLHPKKGVDLLLRAFARLNESQLHLVVAGPAISAEYEAELRELARPLAGSITFTGMLSGRLKTGAMAACEASVLPSHQENFGYSVVESLALGRPVFLSNQVNIWREIIDDSAGFAAPDTMEGTFDLLKIWQILSTSEIRNLSCRALDCFEKRFRADRAAENFLRTLRDCGVSSNEQSAYNLQPIHA